MFLQSLEDVKHLSVETYRKNNQAVRTPVWFVIHNETIHVITRDKTGKVKRLRNNPSVKVAPCNFFGKPHGNWISGNAKFVTGDEFEKVLRLRRKKYGIMDMIARLVSKSKGNLVVFSIMVD
ncbi:MAG: PPOX class F420-dependent oxidoreductase [Nitrosopumilus sp.]|nr:PPOX class F420-dependent oxidoreductase [Nitrosopumilus sp.]MDH3385796.1 PPOX class F420-dependent oxidoreductase [Nitrosopumilus sp.]